MLINIKDSWTAAVINGHKNYVDSLIKNAGTPSNQLLSDLLSSHGSQLAIGYPSALRDVINYVASEKKRRKLTKQQFAQFLGDCKIFFDYGKFSNKNTKVWNAYSLCAGSTAVMCPYCQEAVSFTIQRTKFPQKGFRPTLDHYYSKSKYPYLALSLYNLIPSCYTCNSSLKGNKNFFTAKHLHPFEDEECIRFEWDVLQHLSDRESGTQSFLVEIKTIASTRNLNNAAKRSIEIFLLKERLDASQRFITPFMEIALRAPKQLIKELNAKLFNSIKYPLTEEDALQFSYSDYKNEWLGRLKADLLDAARNHENKP